MPYDSVLHIPPTNYHRLPAAKQKPYQKAYPLTKNIEKKMWKQQQQKKVRRMGQWAEKKKEKKRRKHRKTKERRQKKKRGDIKVESNDSPQIPERGWGWRDIRHPRPLFGEGQERKKE